jgi:FkbM family methyltransferase
MVLGLIKMFVLTVRAAYGAGLNRGWSRLGLAIGRISAQSHCLPVECEDVGTVFVDLRESMCFPAIASAKPFVTETQILKKIAKSGDVVYDIGANFGWTAAVCSRVVGDEGRIIAFEPASRALILLKKNAASRKNMTVYGAALGSGCYEADYYIPECGSMASLRIIDRQIPVTRIESVRVERIDDIVKRDDLPTPDVIKCDVEGFEFEVFKGAKRAFSNAPVVCFEYLDSFARELGYNFSDVAEFLLSCLPDGTKIYRVSQDGALQRNL